MAPTGSRATLWEGRAQRHCRLRLQDGSFLGPLPVLPSVRSSVTSLFGLVLQRAHLRGAPRQPPRRQGNKTRAREHGLKCRPVSYRVHPRGLLGGTHRARALACRHRGGHGHQRSCRRRAIRGRQRRFFSPTDDGRAAPPRLRGHHATLQPQARRRGKRWSSTYSFHGVGP